MEKGQNKKSSKATLIVFAVLVAVGVVAGIFAIAYGAGMLDVSRNYVYMVDTNILFGADYYTESYHAMAVAANSTYNTYRIVNIGFGSLLVAVGLFMTAFSAVRAIKAVFAVVEAFRNGNSQEGANETDNAD